MEKNEPKIPHEEIVIKATLQGGFSEMESVLKHHFTSGRNYISTLERHLGVKFHREKEQAQNGGLYYRYTVADRQTAQKLLTYANHKAERYHRTAFTQAEIKAILARFNHEETE
ncbi:hypothetical protein A4G19_14320 [Pasteurellaceae bacterium Macca]|nr:hypothetical protein [Pasteurellaceae bacterium Macca]MCK3656029.1 hypothetical protein [Pasteurellaceae bacterium Macca]MCK3656044.1 hypothetical protein [Pasteurellaceae bacterium Macca]MCK3656061.1 hypothetical protein [Pasteurellaceae bacterium Macca]MCK3656076.1 hypothetical protein [Pasteurellaceae bacterium Macca]